MSMGAKDESLPIKCHAVTVMVSKPVPESDHPSEKALVLNQIKGKLLGMNEDEVQCPSCGEWFVISPVGPEDYGSQLDYDCEVC